MWLNLINVLLLINSLWLPGPLRLRDGEQASERQEQSARPKAQMPDGERDREIAARFAPAFHQAIGERRRSDLITNFNFDGDWRGDNNWAHAEDQRFPHKGYVYYAVSETQTHYFVYYAVFHPQDYKGGRNGTFLSKLVKEGSKISGKYDPTGLSYEAAIAHENDMEGCLIVAAKKGDDLKSATVSFVETMAHNKFLKYASEATPVSGYKTFAMEEQNPQLYIEPKGHGISAYESSVRLSPHSGMLIYRFTGQADDPGEKSEGTVGYELLPLSETLWPRAHDAPNQTFGAAYKYAPLTVGVALKSGQVVTRKVSPGSLGSAFLGSVGAPNAAHPPWGWFDRTDREQPLGTWFFDPATTVKRHFNLGNDFSLAYLSAPLIGIPRQ